MPYVDEKHPSQGSNILIQAIWRQPVLPSRLDLSQRRMKARKLVCYLGAVLCHAVSMARGADVVSIETDLCSERLRVTKERRTFKEFGETWRVILADFNKVVLFLETPVTCLHSSFQCFLSNRFKITELRDVLDNYLSCYSNGARLHFT